jgi:hypothetical protein
MPSFFFDTPDGDRFIRDEIGLEVESLQAARCEAMAALPAISQEGLLGGDLEELFAIARIRVVGCSARQGPVKRFIATSILRAGSGQMARRC